MADDFDSIAEKYGGPRTAAPTDPQDDFSHILARFANEKIKSNPTAGEAAWDVTKQIPTGLALGVASIPAFPGQVANLIGTAASPYIEKAADLLSPGKGAEMAAEEAKRQAFIASTKKQFGEPGLEKYLPDPTTEYGKSARTVSEFIAPAVAGARYSVPKAVGVGAITGAGSEAAGRAAEGTAVEPYARVLGAIVAGLPGAKYAEKATATTAAREAMDTAEAAGNQGFRQFRQAGFYFDPATTAPNYTVPLKLNLTSEGLTPRTAGKTWEVLNDIDSSPFVNPTQLQERYKELGSVAKKAGADTEERRAARIAQERLLTFAENPPPGVVQGGDPAAGVALLRRANADWAAKSRAELLDQRIAAGELRAGANYSGLNLENELRRRVGALGGPEQAGGMRGATEGERAAFTAFGQGDLASNTRRYLKNLLGGGGGLGALAGSAAAGGAGAYYGLDPLSYAGTVGLLGLGMAKYSNLSSLQRARELQLRLMQRSPSAVEAGIPGTRSGAPYTFAPPLFYGDQQGPD
jgi:hypothetical protein